MNRAYFPIFTLPSYQPPLYAGIDIGVGALYGVPPDHGSIVVLDGDSNWACAGTLLKWRGGRR